MLAEVVSRTVEDALRVELAESRAAAAVVTAEQAVAEARVAAAEAAAAEAGAALQASSHRRLGCFNALCFLYGESLLRKIHEVHEKCLQRPWLQASEARLATQKEFRQQQKVSFTGLTKIKIVRRDPVF
jgi:hypothetical protein